MPRITITKRHVKINKVHQTLITTLFLDRVTSFLNTKIFCTTSNSKPATLLSGMTVHVLDEQESVYFFLFLGLLGDLAQLPAYIQHS
jgi:hypothetical protein